LGVCRLRRTVPLRTMGRGSHDGGLLADLVQSKRGRERVGMTSGVGYAGTFDSWADRRPVGRVGAHCGSGRGKTCEVLGGKGAGREG